MQRVFGAIAVFAGWLAIVIGAVAGLVVSEFLGLAHTEGAAPPQAVFGLAGAFVLWIFIFAAFVAGIPMAYAMFADDPRVRLRVLAVIEALSGALLLPDPLGRAFGVPLLAGAVCTWIGGELIYRGARAGQSTAAGPWVPADPFAAATAATTAAATAAATTSAAGTTGLNPVAATAAGSTAANPEAAGPVAALAPARAPAPVRGRRRASKTAAVTQRVCPWCMETVPADAQTCPHCNAALSESELGAMPIPGVTEVEPKLRKYIEDSRSGKRRGGMLGLLFNDPNVIPPASPMTPSDDSALRPPSAELKAEMLRLDAEIAAGTASSGSAAEVGADGAETPATQPSEPSESANPPQS